MGSRQAAWDRYTLNGQTLASLLRERDRMLSEASWCEHKGKHRQAAELKKQAEYINQLGNPLRQVIADAVAEATKPTWWERFKKWVK